MALCPSVCPSQIDIVLIELHRLRCFAKRDFSWLIGSLKEIGVYPKHGYLLPELCPKTINLEKSWPRHDASAISKWRSSVCVVYNTWRRWTWPSVIDSRPPTVTCWSPSVSSFEYSGGTTGRVVARRAGPSASDETRQENLPTLLGLMTLSVCVCVCVCVWWTAMESVADCMGTGVQVCLMPLRMQYGQMHHLEILQQIASTPLRDTCRSASSHLISSLQTAFRPSRVRCDWSQLWRTGSCAVKWPSDASSVLSWKRCDRFSTTSGFIDGVVQEKQWALWCISKWWERYSWNYCTDPKQVLL